MIINTISIICLDSPIIVGLHELNVIRIEFTIGERLRPIRNAVTV